MKSNIPGEVAINIKHGYAATQIIHALVEDGYKVSAKRYNIPGSNGIRLSHYEIRFSDHDLQYILEDGKIRLNEVLNAMAIYEALREEEDLESKIIRFDKDGNRVPLIREANYAIIYFKERSNG